MKSLNNKLLFDFILFFYEYSYYVDKIGQSNFFFKYICKKLLFFAM